jgi:hypothetical protein
MTWMIVLVSIGAWLAIGYMSGRGVAARTFEGHRRRYPALSRNDPYFGRGEAVFAFLMCLLGGPFAVLPAVACSAVDRHVPGLVEAAAAEKRAELAHLQRQIDDAHRSLGLPPLHGGGR